MATHPDQIQLDRDEQVARISKLVDDVVRSQAETHKIVSETRFLPIATVFQGFIAMAALIGAGAAIGKLLFP